MSGQLVDSTLVVAPKQRNTREEKQAVRAGRSAHEFWPDRPAKARQKDVDARWTVQTGKARRDADRTLLDIAIPSFGYKAHASIDRRYRLIRCWEVTDASRHDGHWLRQGLLDPANTGAGVWADTAYRSQQNETFLERPRVQQPHPSPAPTRSAAVCTHSPRQCQAITRPGSGRARVRGTEAGDGTVRPHDRSRPSAHQDRDGQPRLQPPAPGPTSGLRYRLTSQPRDPYARTS